jgi:hypothetical protein
MKWFLPLLALISWTTAGGLAVAIVASLLRKWTFAATIAGWSAVLGLAVFAFIAVLLAGLWFNPRAFGNIVRVAGRSRRT